MPLIHPRLGKGLRRVAALTALACFAGPAAAQAACPTASTVKAFKALGDSADYFWRPTALLSPALVDWSLTGASVVSGNESCLVRAGPTTDRLRSRQRQFDATAAVVEGFAELCFVPRRVVTECCLSDDLQAKPPVHRHPASRNRLRARDRPIARTSRRRLARPAWDPQSGRPRRSAAAERRRCSRHRSADAGAEAARDAAGSAAASVVASR
jgi:hypothetical protein